MVALEENEYIVKEVRRHWFFIILQVISSILFALAPLIMIVGVRLMGDTEAAFTLLKYIGVLSPLWILGVWISFFYFWTDYYLDVLVITNKRLLDIDQNGLFNRVISTFPLQNIQEVTIHTNGILATLLKFGDVHVKTASEADGFTIHTAADPELVKQIITEQHDKVLADMRQPSV